MDQSLQVLSKVRAVLLANTTLNTLVNGKIVYTIPQQTTFPYVLLTISSSPDDTKTETSMDYLVRIQGFSRTLDQLQALQIKSEVYNSLHRQEMSLNLEGLVQCIQKGANTVFKENDGTTWQCVSDYHLWVEG